jgi:hypothetical protein
MLSSLPLPTVPELSTLLVLVLELVLALELVLVLAVAGSISWHPRL